MKQLIFLLFTLIASRQTIAQDTECLKKMRTGNFIYSDQGSQSVIIRTDKLQTEIFNNGQSRLILKIKWTSETTYVLKLKKAINAPGCLKKGYRVTTTIISCSGDEYVGASTSKKCGDITTTYIRTK
jgi:hypothetical protein